MTDRYDENLFLGYVEGDLSPEDRARFERQMALDAPLRLLAEQVLRDRHSLRELPDEAAPPQIMEQVNQALERAMLFEEPTPQHLAAGPQHFRLMRWGRYAAVAALVALSVGVLIRTLLVTTVAPPPTGGGNRTANAGNGNEKLTGQQTENSQLALADRGEPRTLLEQGSEGQYAKLSPADRLREKQSALALDTTKAGEQRNHSLAAASQQQERESALPVTGSKPGDLKLTGGPFGRGLGADRAGMGGGAGKGAGHVDDATAAPPRIEIAAADPAASEKSLLAWCVQNKITVITTTEMGKIDQAPAAMLALQTDADKGGQAISGAGVHPVAPVAPGVAAGSTPAVAPGSTSPGSPLAAAPTVARGTFAENKDRAEQAKPAAAQPADRLAATVQTHQITVRIPAEQMPRLLAYLNADQSQTAHLVAAPVSTAQRMQTAENVRPTVSDGQLGLSAPSVAISATQPAKTGNFGGGLIAKAPPTPGFPAPGMAASPKPGSEENTPSGAEPVATAHQGQSSTAPQRDASKNENAEASKAAKTEAAALADTDWGGILRQQLPLRESARLGDASKDLEIPVIIYQRDAAK